MPNKLNIRHINTFYALLIICITIFPFSCKRDSNKVNSGPFFSYSESGYVFPPEFSPLPGTYDHDLEVEIYCMLDWATVYYTTDGSDPDIRSKVYKEPIRVSGNGTSVTIKAIAITRLHHESEIATAAYTINWSACSTPAFNPLSGSYVGPQKVTISSTEGATIKYTTDGSDPKTSSTAITGNIATIDAMTEVRAYAYKEDKFDSDISIARYNIFEDLGFPDVEYVVNEKILIGPDNRPIVAFEDEINGLLRMHVYKLNAENSWDDLGYFDDYLAELAVGSDSKPVIVYRDSSNGGKAHVMKWNSGTSWDDLGLVGGELQEKKIAIGPDDRPVVLLKYWDWGYFIRAFKWESGVSWSDMGIFDDYTMNHFSLAVANNNKPSLIYQDNSNDYKLGLLMWDSGTAWLDPGYLTPNGYNPVIVMGQDNLPIFMFTDGDNDYRAHVMKGGDDSTLIDYGLASIYDESGKAIAIGTDGRPVVATVQYTISDTDVHVAKWVSGITWQTIGIIDYGYAYDCSIAVGTDNMPVVAFDDDCERLMVYRCIIR